MLLTPCVDNGHGHDFIIMSNSIRPTSVMTSYSAYLETYPGRKEFVKSFDFGNAVDLPTGSGKNCFEVTVCGLIKVAVHHGTNGRLYIRALDFTLEGPSCSRNPVIRTAAIEQLFRGKSAVERDPRTVIGTDIHNYSNSIGSDIRPSKASRQILSTYRSEVGDPEADATTSMGISNLGSSQRTNHKFIAIEILPHLLSHIGFYDTPPDPSWIPVWNLIKKMEPLRDCGLAEPRTRGRKQKVEAHPPRIVSVASSTSGIGSPHPAPCKEDVPTLPVDTVVSPEVSQVDAGVLLLDSEGPVILPEVLATSETVNDLALTQLRRPMLIAIVRSLRKDKLDLQVRLREAAKKSSSEDLTASRTEASKLRYKLKQSQAEAAEYKAESIMLRRDATERIKIEQAMDPDNIELVEPVTVRMMNSYHSLLKRTDATSADALRHRTHLHKAALVTLDKVIAERRHFKSIAESHGIHFDNPSIEIQTDISWSEIELREQLKAQKEVQEAHNELISTITKEKDKSRISQVPALKGREAEDRLLELLVSMAPVNCTVLLTRSIGHCGDYILLFRDSSTIIGYAIIDCKSYTGSVPVKQVEKLKDDIDKSSKTFGSPPHWAAIISMESDIIYNGSSGASDFSHDTTPVFLMHSSHKRGDNGSSSIRDMLGRAKFYGDLKPYTFISVGCSITLEALETRLSSSKRQGRGRSHSQARSRVTFSDSSQVGLSRVASTHVTPVQEETDDDQIDECASDTESHGHDIHEDLQLAGRPSSHVPLDPLIFVPETSMSVSDLRIAIAMSQRCQYRAGSRLKGKVITENLATYLGRTVGRINKVIKRILVEGIRSGHWLVNVEII